MLARDHADDYLWQVSEHADMVTKEILAFRAQHLDLLTSSLIGICSRYLSRWISS